MAMTTRTASTETICDDYVCTKTLYGGTMFAQNNAGEWVDASDVLRITKEEDDLTFAYDGIKGQMGIVFEVGVIHNSNYYSMSEVKTMYPEIQFDFPTEKRGTYRKYSVNITNLPVAVRNLEMVTLTYKNHYGFGIGQLMKSNNKYLIKDVFELLFTDAIASGNTLNIDVSERRIEIGNLTVNGDSVYIDPSVILQDVDSDILDDAGVRQDYPNAINGSLTRAWFNNEGTFADGADGYLKFNLSSIFSDSNVIDASINLSINLNLNWTKASEIRHVYNNTWTEENITWNNQPCGAEIINSTQCNLTIQDNFTSVVLTDRVIFNVTDIVKYYVAEGNDSISFVISYNSSNTNFESLSFVTKESSTVSARPRMTLTYTVKHPNIDVYLYSPLNNSLNSGTVDFQCQINTTDSDEQNATIYGNWSGGWNANKTNSTFNGNLTTINIAGLTTGVYLWNCLGFNNESNSTFYPYNFTMNIDSTIPVLNITHPTNNTDYTISTLDLNFTITEPNIGSCWYQIDQNGTNFSIAGCSNTSVVFNLSSHNLTLFANDSVGNLAVAKFVNFTVANDTSNPFINFIYPTEGLTVTSGNIDCTTQNLSFNYSVTEYTGVDACWYTLEHSINGIEFENRTLSSCTNTTFVPTKGCAGNPNFYNITIYSNDTIGNEGSQNIKFFLSFPPDEGGGGGGSSPFEGNCDIIVTRPLNQKITNLYCPPLGESRSFPIVIFNNDTFSHNYVFKSTGEGCNVTSPINVEGQTFYTSEISSCLCPDEGEVYESEITVFCQEDSSKSKRFDVELHGSWIGKFVNNPFVLAGIIIAFIVSVLLIYWVVK